MEDKQLARLKLRMAAIPLVITRLDLAVTPLDVLTIMKGNNFQFQFSSRVLHSIGMLSMLECLAHQDRIDVLVSTSTN